MTHSTPLWIAAALLAGSATTWASPDDGGDERETALVESEDEMLERADALVWFQFDSARLTLGARRTLDAIADRLRDRIDHAIVIEGHADRIGGDEYNFSLGERRAEAVRDYLIAQGIEESRIHVVSFGEHYEISATNRFNRRVVIRPAALEPEQPEPEPEQIAPVVELEPGPAPARPAPAAAPPAGPAVAAPEPLGISFGAGGGVVGFLDPDTRDFSDPGGLWELRVAYGTRSRVAVEAAYSGSAQSIDALGLDTDAVLVGHGVESAVRLNMTVDRAWQPYGFAGLGYTYYSVEAASFNTSSLQDHEDTIRVPLGVGFGYRVGSLRFDLRGTLRQAIDDGAGLARDTGGEAATFSSWSADAKAGWEF